MIEDGDKIIIQLKNKNLSFSSIKIENSDNNIVRLFGTLRETLKCFSGTNVFTVVVNSFGPTDLIGIKTADERYFSIKYSENNIPTLYLDKNSNMPIFKIEQQKDTYYSISYIEPSNNKKYYLSSNGNEELDTFVFTSTLKDTFNILNAPTDTPSKKYTPGDQIFHEIKENVNCCISPLGVKTCLYVENNLLSSKTDGNINFKLKTLSGGIIKKYLINVTGTNKYLSYDRKLDNIKIIEGEPLLKDGGFDIMSWTKDGSTFFISQGSKPLVYENDNFKLVDSKEVNIKTQIGSFNIFVSKKNETFIGTISKSNKKNIFIVLLLIIIIMSTMITLYWIY